MYTANRLDSGINTFSPEGRLFQVEYALEAIKLGSTAIGIQTNEGILLAVEKRVESKLMIPASNSKIFEIDKHIGAVYSGLTADGRSLIDFARVQSQSYWFTYDESIPIKSITRIVADQMMSFAAVGDDDDENDNDNSKKMARPYGVAMLLAGVDEKGPSLYVIDPSGTMVQYLAVAVGAGGESAMSVLQDRYAKSMTLREAEDLAIEILKQVMEAKIEAKNVELSVIDAKNGQYHIYNEDDLKDIIARAKISTQDLDTQHQQQQTTTTST
jgi:20S proteasome subunit alpha 5